MYQKQVGLITGLHCMFISKSIDTSFELSHLSFWDLNSNQYICTSFTLLTVMEQANILVQNESIRKPHQSV